MENSLKELSLVDLVVIQDAKHLVSDVFYEIVKPKHLVVAEKSVPYVVSDDGKSLSGYSQHEIDNWAGNVEYHKDKAGIIDFVKKAKKDKDFRKKLRFGTIDKTLAETIKKATGAEVEGYNVAITSDEVRKIFKDHGNESTEAPRGQRAVVDEDFANIPEIIQNPDKISLDSKPYAGKPVIHFTKTINGRTTVVSYVSDKQHDLRVQTIYSGRKKKAEL